MYSKIYIVKYCKILDSECPALVLRTETFTSFHHKPLSGHQNLQAQSAHEKPGATRVAQCGTTKKRIPSPLKHSKQHLRGGVEVIVSVCAGCAWACRFLHLKAGSSEHFLQFDGKKRFVDSADVRFSSKWSKQSTNKSGFEAQIDAPSPRSSVL